jgi:hypothetical protein
MQYMLEATGSVGAPGWDEPITAANVVEVLGKDVFLLESGSASDRVQDQIGTAVWDAVQTTNTSGTAMASALARASSERHLQVYSVHPEEEAILSRLDVTGAAELGRNPLSVVWEATSDNKVGYFIDRRMNVKVKLDEDGTATVKTTLRLRNDAPDGPPSRLLGEGTDVGDWSSLVSVYLPERIAGDPTFTGGLPGSSDTLEEFGHRVAFGEIFTPSGGSSTWTVTYEVPDAVTSVDSASEYRLDFLPQPTLSPIELDIQVELPESRSVTLTSPGMQTNGRTTIYADSPTTAQSFWVRFV